jgi:hypothetical protein
MMTATSETKRPIPENMAIETNCELSDSSDADDTGTDVEMRATFGMAALQWITFKNIPALNGVFATRTKVQ